MGEEWAGAMEEFQKIEPIGPVDELVSLAKAYRGVLNVWMRSRAARQSAELRGLVESSVFPFLDRVVGDLPVLSRDAANRG